MKKFQVKYTSSKSNKVCSRKVDARNASEAESKARSWFGNVELILDCQEVKEVKMTETNRKCGNPQCNNNRHVTKSGRVRGYCRECENKASLKSKAKSKMADLGHEVHCCEACMNSVLPIEECVCRCGGEFHGINHNH